MGTAFEGNRPVRFARDPFLPRPPYWGCEVDYGASAFERADFERLADQLDGIAGRFILSIHDAPGAPNVFGRFTIDTAETTWTIATAAAGAGKRVTELIVRSPSTL